jgi:hypothetical protein
MCYFGAYVSQYPALLPTLHTLPVSLHCRIPLLFFSYLVFLKYIASSLSSIAPAKGNAVEVHYWMKASDVFSFFCNNSAYLWDASAERDLEINEERDINVCSCVATSKQDGVIV